MHKRFMHDIAYLVSVANTSFVEQLASKILSSSAIITDFDSYASLSQLGFVVLQLERGLDGHLEAIYLSTCGYTVISMTNTPIHRGLLSLSLSPSISLSLNP